MLNVLELGLGINKPYYVKRAWFSFDRTGEEVWDDGNVVEEGLIRLHVVTSDKSFILEWTNYWAFIGAGRDEALSAFARSLIEEEDYIKVWYRIDFEKGDWKEEFTRNQRDEEKDREAVRECYEDFCNTFKEEPDLKDKGQQLYDDFEKGDWERCLNPK